MPPSRPRCLTVNPAGGLYFILWRSQLIRFLKVNPIFSCQLTLLFMVDSNELWLKACESSMSTYRLLTVFSHRSSVFFLLLLLLLLRRLWAFLDRHAFVRPRRHNLRFDLHFFSFLSLISSLFFQWKHKKYLQNT